MNLSKITLTAFIFYAFLGICPMQVSMMAMPMSDEDMAMMHHTMPMEMGTVDEFLAKMNNCWNCLRAIDSFALKDTQILVFNASPQAIVSLPHIQAVNDVSDLDPIPLARLGPPPLVSLITETIVLRT